MRESGESPAPPREVEQRRFPSHRESLRFWFELAGAWSLAIAWPVYQRLQSGSEALTFYSVRGKDLLLFIVLVSLVAPTLFLAVEALVSRLASFRAARVLHAVALGVLLGLVVWQPLQNDGVIATLVLILVVAAVSVLYLRLELIRNFALMLGVATPVVIALFAFSYPFKFETLPGERAMAAQTATSNPPVVMIVMDELPLALLQNEKGKIDADLFPALARIQKESTWYPRTLAVGDETLAALPAIMTGEETHRTAERTPPGLPSYPDNVCTILAKAGYRIRATEIVTDLCQRKSGLATRISDLLRLGIYPKNISLDEAPLGGATEPKAEDLTPGRILEKSVEKAAARYPSPPEVWAIERPGYVQRFAEGLDTSPGGFNFLHILLPHAPYQFTDTGLPYPSYVLGDNRTAIGLETPNNQPEVNKNTQQATSQTIASINLLESVVKRMKETGTWDESMFVLTADHGASFQVGSPRRTVIEDNEGWLLPVPLFIKYPGQTKGRIDPRFATSRDITPTVLDVLGLKPGPNATGHSLLGPPVPPPERIEVTSQRNDSLTVDPKTVEEQREAAVKRKAAVFPEGELFAPGGHRNLLGDKAASNPRLKQLKAEFATGGPEIEIVPGQFFLPSYIQAELPDVKSDPGTIAVAFNGRVVATTRAWDRDGAWMTGVNVPGSSFREGTNRIALFSYRP